TDNFVVDFDLTHRRRDGWIVYQGENNFGAFHGTVWQPKIDMLWFLAADHQVRFTLQWVGARADERGFFAVPEGDGDLIPAARTEENHDFSASLLTAQLRYRWEIAPLTDLFVVYNIGNSLSPSRQAAFQDLFTDSFDDPTLDAFIVKLRYRFGN
ncbi:MAG: DUF5916 domain-containing protein, partial [Pseudomonadota bacterium]